MRFVRNIVTNTKSNIQSIFYSVERQPGGQNKSFTLKGQTGKKSLTLEYAEPDGLEGLAVWMEALRFLLLR